MSKKDDGGPAFQQFSVDPWKKPYITGGMKLRDWFAGQALNGLATYRTHSTPEQVASDAYEIADAMLAERAK